MACEGITRSRYISCADNFSGIRAIGILPIKTGLTLTSDGLFEGVGITGSIYRWEVDADANVGEGETQIDPQTLTNVTTQTLNLTIQGIDNDTLEQIRKLSYGKPKLFLEMFDDKTILLMGHKNGCRLLNYKVSTGGARTDLSGITLTFEAKEKRTMAILGATGSTAYNNAINLTNAING